MREEQRRRLEIKQVRPILRIIFIAFFRMNTLLQHIFLLNYVFRQRPNVVKRHIIGTQTGLSYCLVGVILHLSLPIYLERVKKPDLGVFPCWLPSGCADMLAEFVARLCKVRGLHRPDRELI